MHKPPKQPHINADMYKSLSQKEERFVRFFSSTKNLLMVLGMVIYLGIYLGELLFGSDSLEVYLNLQENKKQLLQEVSRFQKANAELQKQYLEIRELQPENVQ